MYVLNYLAAITPRKVEVVTSDGGGEFSKGAIGALCIAEKIRKYVRQPIPLNKTALLNDKSQS